MRLFLSVLFLACTLAAQALHPLGGPLPSSYRKTLADQLVVADPQKRAAATMRLRADGEVAYLDFSAGLGKAENYAVANLRRLMQMIKPTDPSFEAVRKELTAYNTA